MRRLTEFLVLGLLILVGGSLSGAYADVIYLKSGGDLKGLVVEEHRDRIVVNIQGKEQVFLRAEIEEVFYEDLERNYLYLGNQAIEHGEWDLGREFFQKSLQIHPQFREAEEALGRLEDLRQKVTAEIDPNPLTTLQTRWGIVLEKSDRFPEVQRVRDGSFGARLGIAPGDRLVSAWGGSLAFLPLEETARALLGPVGSELKLALERSLRLPAAAPRDRVWPGLTLKMEPPGLTVASVSAGGAAEAAGVQPGDRIVALAGVVARYLPIAEVRRRIQESKRQGLPSAIHRDLLFKRE